VIDSRDGLDLFGVHKDAPPIEKIVLYFVRLVQTPCYRRVFRKLIPASYRLVRRVW
jgi:hypothetical protein